MLGIFNCENIDHYCFLLLLFAYQGPVEPWMEMVEAKAVKEWNKMDSVILFILDLFFCRLSNFLNGDFF